MQIYYTFRWADSVLIIYSGLDAAFGVIFNRPIASETATNEQHKRKCLQIKSECKHPVVKTNPGSFISRARNKTDNPVFTHRTADVHKLNY